MKRTFNIIALIGLVLFFFVKSSIAGDMKFLGSEDIPNM